MKERPILFSGPMVRAILAGQKTQTRRLVKPQPAHSCRYEMNGNRDKALHLATGHDGTMLFVPVRPGTDHRLPCPYGATGDRLWIRETWAGVDHLYGRDQDPPQNIAYRADRSAVVFEHGGKMAHQIPDWDSASWNWDRIQWRPSIFMPRWASRITLDVTAIQIERLQDISGDDARAEGIEVSPCDCEACSRTSVMCPAVETSYIEAYRELWDRINGKRSPWSSNPWVWVVSFKKLEAS